MNLLLYVMHWTIFWRRVKAALPYALAVAFTVLVAFVTLRHEMWRDELQAWLLARDSATPLQLLYNMRYDGHPGLWHLLLWPLARLSPNPVLMQALHVALAGMSALLVFRFSPFSWGVKILLVLGYFFAYEWAAIARNYAISVLLLFAICALFEQRWIRFPAIAAALFLLCHTNIFALLLVLALAVTLPIEFAMAYAGRHRQAERCLGRFLAGMGLIVLGLLTGIRQTIPPSDTSFDVGLKWRWKTGDADNLGGIVTRAYLPVPVERLNFWNSNRFMDKPWNDRDTPLIPQSDRFDFGLTLLALGSLFFLKKPWLVVPYWLGSLALLTFHHVMFDGMVRHHGFLYLWFITLLWMSFSYRPWKIPWRWADCLLAFWDRHRMKVLAPLLALHVWGTAIAIKVDWMEPFSQAKAVALWLRKEYRDLTPFIFVGDSSPTASAVVGYLELARIYYPDRTDFGSYIIWDQQRLRNGGRRLDRQVEELMRKTGKDAILILDHEQGETEGRGETTLLEQFPAGTVGNERYWIYRWPENANRGS